MAVDTDPPAPARRRRRSWPQRLTIAGAAVGAVACFASAAALYGGQQVVEDRNLVSIVNPADRSADAGFGTADAPPRTADPVETSTSEAPASSAPDEPPPTFPPAEPDARNFLVTGADNNSCIDPDSPYAPAFGDRGDLGERSDTIMMWRVDPATSQVAVLSFPRDLWVTIPGSDGKQRINVAYERDAPQDLIDTIYANFGVPTDHFLQIDFCAFKTLVDAVGGVEVPFANAVRDANTGLNVPEPGCFNFDGDHALAYVRSRKLEVLTAEGEWEQDVSSDLGRISRQQDFIRRVADELLSARVDPDVIGGLVETNSEYVVVDSDLTTRRILEFAGVVRNVDPADITTYQIEATPTVIQGNSVLEPRLSGDNMSAILSVFQGEAALASAPEQVVGRDDGTVAGTGDAGSGDDTADDAGTGDGADAPDPDATAADPRAADEGTGTVRVTTQPGTSELPEVEAEEIVYGYVPDDSISC